MLDLIADILKETTKTCPRAALICIVAIVAIEAISSCDDKRW